MLAVLLPLSIIGTTVLVSRKSRAANGKVDGGASSDIEFPEPIVPTSLDTRSIVAAANAPEIYQDLFALIAYGESKGRDDVARGIEKGTPPWAEVNIATADAKAAKAAYQRNIEWLKPCWDAQFYTAASYGRYQMFPASALAAFRSSAIFKCLHPWSLFDPIPSTIMAIWMCRRLQGWDNYDGRVVTMRAAWANPTTMHEPSAAKIDKWRGHCQAVGLPPSFLDKKLPPWKPAPAVELFDRMGGDPIWLPESMQAEAMIQEVA